MDKRVLLVVIPFLLGVIVLSGRVINGSAHDMGPEEGLPAGVRGLSPTVGIGQPSPGSAPKPIAPLSCTPQAGIAVMMRSRCIHLE